MDVPYRTLDLPEMPSNEHHRKFRPSALMPALLVLCSTGVLADPGSAGAGQTTPGGAPSTSTTTNAPAVVSPYQPDRFAGRASRYYARAWGIESLSVKLVESGELIRFSYRVIEPARATLLTDKRLTPSLIDRARSVSLVVPEMENVGMLRQMPPPKANMSYWVVFSNKGRLVQRGDHVDVVIGTFRAENLVVD